MKYRYNRFNNSKIIIKDLGFIISLVAPIRTGKTSLMAGLKHVLEEIIIDDIKETMEKIIIKLYFINFNTIDSFIRKNIKTKNNFKLLTNNLIEYLETKDFSIFDSINYNTLYDLLYDYIYCFYCLNYRNNYVMSKTKVYSRITGNFNMNYNVSNQEIYNSFKNEDYSIEDYVVELIDESSDDIGASKYFNDVKEESGLKDYKRKYGHLHKEKNKLVITKQDASDEIKKLRFLNNNEIKIIKKVKILNGLIVFNFLINFRLLFIHITNIIYIFFRYLKYKISTDKRLKLQPIEQYNLKDFFVYRRYINNKNIKYKKKLYFYQLLQNTLIYFFSFNKYFVNIYTSSKEIINEQNTGYKKVLFIPTRLCFGVYDNFEFRYLQLDLLEHSKEYAIEVLREDIKNITDDIEKNKKSKQKELYIR